MTELSMDTMVSVSNAIKNAQRIYIVSKLSLRDLFEVDNMDALNMYDIDFIIDNKYEIAQRCTNAMTGAHSLCLFAIENNTKTPIISTSVSYYEINGVKYTPAKSDFWRLKSLERCCIDDLRMRYPTIAQGKNLFRALARRIGIRLR